MTAYPFKHGLRPLSTRPSDPTRPSKNISTSELVLVAEEMVGKGPEERARLIRKMMGLDSKPLDEPQESE